MRRLAVGLLLMVAAGPACAQRVSAGVYPCAGDSVGKVTRMMRTGSATWRCVPDDAGPVRVDTLRLPAPPPDTVRIRDTVWLTRPDTAPPRDTVPQIPGNSGSAEPAGMTTLFDADPSMLQKRDDGNWSVVQDASAPRSASSVLRARYPARMSPGSGPVAWYPVGGQHAPRQTFYFATWLKFSGNFVTHPSGINKLVHFYSCGINNVYLQARDGDLKPSLGMQQLAFAYNGGTATQIYPSSGTFVRDRWHKVEVVLVANTPGQRDGSASVWLNGARVIDAQGVGFCASGSNARWEGWNFNPTYGGAEATTNPEMYLYVDHIRTSGK